MLTGNSTWASVGATKTSDPAGQIAAGLRYISSAYGDPIRALNAWLSRSPHWYGAGGLITEPIFGVGASGRTYGFGERGVETVIPGRGGATVVNNYYLSFPHYVGDKNDLVRAIDDLKRHRRI